MKKVWLRLPKETIEKIESLAASRGEMPSDTMRELIRIGLVSLYG